MKKFNRTLKTAGMWCMIASLMNVVSLFSNIYLIEFAIYNIIWDVLSITLSITTGIIYLCYSKQSKEKLEKPKNIFFILTILNIFNNLIVWVLSFWVQVSYNREMVKMNIGNVSGMENNNQSFNSSKEDDENIITISKEDYEIKRKSDTSTSRLEELKDLRTKNLISEEEYEQLKQKAIKKFIS